MRLRTPAWAAPFAGLLPILLAAAMMLSTLPPLILDLDARPLHDLVGIAMAPGLAAYAASVYGWRFTVKAFALLFFGGLGVEVLGLQTGFPFGVYTYTQRLQPQLLGVPIQIPLAWFFLGIMSYSLAHLTPVGRKEGIVAAAALMTAWDVLYDPIFTSVGWWTWVEGDYFGVPLTNFLGWLLASFFLFTLLRAGFHRDPKPPSRLARMAPIILYLVYIIDGVANSLFLDQTPAGIVGGLLTTVTLILVHRRALIRTRLLIHPRPVSP